MKLWGGSVRRGLPLIAVVFSLLPFLWFTHVYLSARGDPLGERFDLGLWISASVFKLAAFAVHFWLLAHVHKALFASASALPQRSPSGRLRWERRWYWSP